MKKIGIIPMSAKPFHLGHSMLIDIASKECDVVKLYVSTSDRKRKGELTISGEKMKLIWDRYIEPTLPDNVEVTYGGSPVRNAWEELGAASENESTDVYVLYSDPTDLASNFPDASRAKYAPNLERNGRIELRPVDRSSTIDVSGTQMRSFLENDDRESFLSHMPNTVDGNAIWQILRGELGETLLRDYVRNLFEG